ncbi:MAG: hypothetical protein AUI50_08375 [Crenarchaeota archaeon 13_1_40CM_2_52_14]|nr:MAG: hypothetical protein AUI50_08375 [Crenarchaeota archaeon 13_1_40CM_2_52_14]
MLTSPQVIKKQPGLLHFPGLGHFLVVMIFTGIEIVGLIEWLALSKGGSSIMVLGRSYPILQLGAISSRVGMTGFAAVVLAVFLLVEHIITQLDATGRFASGKQLVEILTFSSLESVIWVVWLVLIPVNGILAFTFFLVALFVEHHIADNVKKGLSFFKLSSTGPVFTGLLVLTISEVIGAVVWVGNQNLLAVLVGGSLLEHYIARNVGLIQ